MIEANKWYRFVNQGDRDLFIALAMKRFEFVTHELSGKVRAADMLKVNTEEEGYAYFNYRTTYSPKYNNNVTIFSAAASLSGAGIKEVDSMNNNACGCVSPKGPNDCCAKQPAAVSLVDKYVEEDKRQIIEKHNATAKSILANDPIFKAFAELEAIIKAVNRNNTVRVTFFEAVSKDMLASETQKKLADLDTKTKTKLDALDDKAYECKVLLETATDPNTISSVLSQYGFLRYDEKED